jgi:dihydroorotate dehydrogenase (fumarate)
VADLGTTYLGLDLAHPIVASASPIANTVDGVRRLEDGGAAAIVLPSLFEEQIRLENEALEALGALGADSVSEVQSYFPVSKDVIVGPEAYLDLVRRAKAMVRVPVVASLNGVTPTGWTGYARELAEAGADAIELNVFYIPADLGVTGREVEQRYEDIVREVSDAVPVPVAVKLSPFFSATGEMATRLAGAGARGLVLFNRFYQPDFDLARLDVAPTLELSTPGEIRLPLLWIAVLHGHVRASLAAS